VFGLPYYLAAFLFAVFLARRAREAEVLTIPDQLAKVYGDRVAAAGGIVIFVMTLPAAYVLMLGTLGELLLGWPFWVGVVAGSVVSVTYVYMGGFNSVVRTDVFQFVLMYAGFIVLFVILLVEYGGLSFLVAHLPPAHLTWHGGNPPLYIATWYVIALATLIEPAFFQRCYAASSASVARRGILVSIACWALFDCLTTSVGLYARAILPDLSNPVASYPALAREILPAGLLGLFLLSVVVTVQSTVDSYFFLSASTFGNDIMRRLGLIGESRVTAWTRVGLAVSLVLAIVLALFFRSVVDVWYTFGSIGTPALLVPVFLAFTGRRRLDPSRALLSIIACGGLSLLWYLSKHFTGTGEYWWGLEPIFPGLALSLMILALGRRRATETLPTGRL